MDGLIEGRVVHYVLPDMEDYQKCGVVGEHRPAIVVRNWHVPGYDGMVNLQVFIDGSNDIGLDGHHTATKWATSVHYSEEKEPGTWHWIEKV